MNTLEQTVLRFASRVSMDAISEQMMWRFRLAVIAVVAVVAMVAMVAESLLSGCAPHLDARDIVPPQSYDAQLVRFPPWTGPKRQLHIQEIAVPKIERQRYPALVSVQVGNGLGRLLVEILADTGRFDLIEQRAPLIQRLSDLLQRSADARERATLSPRDEAAPLFLLHAKIFDVSMCTPDRQPSESQAVSTCRTSIGVQIQISNPSGQFVPGATHPLSPQGRYVHAKTMPLFGDGPVSFAQSAMGKVAAKAVRHAVLQAIERLERQGW